MMLDAQGACLHEVFWGQTWISLKMLVVADVKGW